MHPLNVLGILFLVLSVPLLLGAFVLLATDETFVPQYLGDDPQEAGYIYGASGVAAVILGVVLLLVERRIEFRAEARPEPEPEIEIKRTDMGFARPTQATVSDELQGRLDEVSQKLARLKVQYGMGEVSADSYKILKDRLDAEKAQIELQIIEARGA